MAMARAMATRCFCPPESSRGYAASRSASPTRSNSPMARSLASAFDSPSTCTGDSMTFPNAVRWGKSWKSWKIIPNRRRTCRAALWLARWLPGQSVCPPTRIPPASKGVNPLMHRSNVDLPPPLGPITATVRPAAIDSVTPSSTVRGPNRLVTLSSSTFNVLPGRARPAASLTGLVGGAHGASSFIGPFPSAFPDTARGSPAVPTSPGTAPPLPARSPGSAGWTWPGSGTAW